MTSPAGRRHKGAHPRSEKRRIAAEKHCVWMGGVGERATARKGKGAAGEGGAGRAVCRYKCSRKGLPQAVHLFWGWRLGSDKEDAGGERG